MAKILIVDDSMLTRTTLRRILEEAGHEVVGEARDGVESLSMYTNKRPDLVTMDLTMPRTDGLDAIKNIISKFPDARIVVISAIGHKITVLEAIESGAKNYIIKPFDSQKVLWILHKVLTN